MNEKIGYMMWLLHDFQFNQKGPYLSRLTDLEERDGKSGGSEADHIESLPFDTNKQIHSPINAGDI